MKTTLAVLLALVALAVLVFWLLPAALNLIFWVVIFVGGAYAIYSGVRFYQRNEQAVAARRLNKNEQRAHKSAEKSLKQMERALKAGGSPDANPQAETKPPR